MLHRLWISLPVLQHAFAEPGGDRRVGASVPRSCLLKLEGFEGQSTVAWLVLLPAEVYRAVRGPLAGTVAKTAMATAGLPQMSMSPA